MFPIVSVAFLLFVAVAVSNPQPHLLLTPSVVTAFVGDNVTFLCIKDDPSLEIAWIPQINVSLSDNNNVSKLVTGVPDISFNNTEIQCVGRYSSDPNQLYFSNVGKVIIQGILSEIEVNVFRQDFCTIQLSWAPPFTLPGVPILGYNVNITNLDNDITNHIFINDTETNFTLGYDYYVSIAAVNGAGEGNKTNLTINSTKLLNSTKELIINNIHLKRDHDEWEVNAIINVTMIRGNTNVKFIYNFCNNFSCFDTGNITRTKLSNSQTMLSTLLFLPEDQYYDICIEAIVGRNTISSSIKHLSTFDVQSVKEKNSSADGVICLAIYYVTGSTATGCQMNLDCDSNFTFLFHVDGYNNQFHEFWCSPRIPLDENKTCLLQVYDRADQINQNTSGPAVEDTINVTVAMLPSPSVFPSNECSSKIIAVVLPFSIIIAILLITIAILLIIIAIFIVNGTTTKRRMVKFNCPKPKDSNLKVS